MTERENTNMETDLEQEKDQKAKSGETAGEETAKAEAAGAEEAERKAEGQEAADSATQEKEPENAGDAGNTKEKKFFGKKKEKKDKKDEKIEELTDKLTRQMAEFDNYRKRTEKEKASMYEIGAREVIEKILPIVDNFERGLAAVPEEEKETPFVDGMNKIYRQLLSVFEGMGVKTIESVGQEFNPDYHNAVMHVEDEEAGENIVVEEFQKGYTYKDTVIRHSMVKVAN